LDLRFKRVSTDNTFTVSGAWEQGTKTVYNMAITRALFDRLQTDISLRRICGWE